MSETENLLILEIGAGRVDPLDPWQPTAVLRDLADGEFYVGIDIGAVTGPHNPTSQEILDRDDVMRQRWLGIQATRPGVSFVQADAMALPFQDEQFDEVVANNIFGSGIPGMEAKRNVYLEAHRVLKTGGTLVMHDQILPSLNDRTALDDWLYDSGLPHDLFSVMRISPQFHQRRYAEALKHYGFVDRFKPDDYTDAEHKQAIIDLRYASTLWIMTKSALEETVDFDQAEPLHGQAATNPDISSGNGLTRLKRWFGRLTNGFEND